MTSGVARSRVAAVLAVLAAVVLTAASVHAAQRPSPKPSAPASQPRTRVLRVWEDTIKDGDREIARQVQIVFDYDTGVAWEVAFDASGKILSNRRLISNVPQPSPEEFDEAVGILQADVEVGRIMARTSAVPQGGFLLEEKAGRGCGPRTRCIQILLMADNSVGLLRRVVVDLVSRKVIYAAYTPQQDTMGKGK